LEEIKDMSLKSYDLLWVVGKSAAWRYPGEIAELKSLHRRYLNRYRFISYKTDAENPGQDAQYQEIETINTRSEKVIYNAGILPFGLCEPAG
jgi:hypothetical protein